MSSQKNIKLLTWFNFFTDFKLYAPVAIIYFSQVSGSYVLGMSVFSIIMLSAAIFEVPTGIFSDLIGRRKTLILGALFSALGLVFYALGGSYFFLILGAILEGLSRSFYSGNNDALLYDTLAETQQEAEYHVFSGKVDSMFQVALAISAIIGTVIAHWSFSLVLWLSVLSQLTCLGISIFTIEPKIKIQETANVFAHIKEALKNFSKNAKLRHLSLASILDYALGESSYQFRSAFVNTLWPLWAIGISKALSHIGSALSYYFSGKLINKFTELNILIYKKVYGVIINILSLGFPTIISPALMSTTSFFHGVSMTAKNNLLQKEFSSEQRATMGSLNSLFGSLTFSAVSLLLGLFADKIGPTKALLLLQPASLSVLYLYCKLKKKYSSL
ncbi:MAG: MFS transporter [Candidatus Shapirobacteria bacterium]